MFKIVCILFNFYLSDFDFCNKQTGYGVIFVRNRFL